MAKEDNKNLPLIENEESPSNEEKWRAGFSERHPDVDVNDSDAYYGALNDEFESFSQDRAELGRYKEDNERIAALLAENPAFAELFTEMAKGNDGNPWQAIARVAGPDFVKLMEDPENEELAKTVTEGLNEYAERIKRSNELEEEAKENIEPTFAAFDAVCERRGFDEQQKRRLYELWDSIMQGALVNKVDEDTWDMLAKSISYDTDVEEAGEEGEIRGRNAKIERSLRGKPDSSTIGLGNARGGSPTNEPSIEGALGSPEYQKPWYERE